MTSQESSSKSKVKHYPTIENVRKMGYRFSSDQALRELGYCISSVDLRANPGLTVYHMPCGAVIFDPETHSKFCPAKEG